MVLSLIEFSLLVIARLLYGYAQKRYRINQRREGKLYGRAVFQPHFFKKVIREGKDLFVISWQNDGRMAEGHMPLIYGSEDDAEDMQRLAKETTKNPFTVFKNLINREQRIAYTGAIAYFCKSYVFSRYRKYEWIIFSANEDTETLGATTMDRFFAVPLSYLNLFRDGEFVQKNCAVYVEHQVDRAFTLSSVAKQVFELKKTEGQTERYCYQIQELDIPLPGNEIFWIEDVLVHPSMSIEELATKRQRLIERLKALHGATPQYAKTSVESVAVELKVHDEKYRGEVVSLDTDDFRKRFVIANANAEKAGAAEAI